VTGGNRAAAFSLLVDESASMKGQEKFKVATKAAVLLGETLELLDVPLEIIGYSTADFEARAAMQLGLTPAHEYRHMRCSRLEHRIYKRFSEPYASAHLRLTGIQPRCNNWDEEHLMFAFQRLQERQEPRKLMVVISDGQPNGDADNLIHTVERIERQGVKVIGIGVGADFVCQIYPHAIVVKDFRQMAEELLHILEREFLNSANLSAWR
jgi:cobaltochelatase CobT